MSLIDTSYFVGKINLPQVGNTEGDNIVQGFINDYETEFLQKALGYDLWKAFYTGLQQVSVEQKWLNILNGVEYIRNSRTEKWIGFIPLSEGSSLSISSGQIRTLIVGRGQQYDPVSGSGSFTLPPEFVGVDVSVELRGTGTLRSDEYTISGNIFSFEYGALFNDGATVFLKKGAAINLQAAEPVKISPIANYVYYKFIEDDAISQTLVGAAATETDNARRVSPMPKLLDAWNQMAVWLKHLRRFLDLNKATYPQWNQYVVDDTGGVYQYKNSHGL